MYSIIQTLLQTDSINESSSLIITKSLSGKNKEQLLKFLPTKTEIDFLRTWINGNRFSKMSWPSSPIIDQIDKNDIIASIQNSRPINIRNINIGVIYQGDMEDFVKNIYVEEISGTFTEILKNFNLRSKNLQEQKQFFENQILSDLYLQLEASPLISLLKPISMNIFTNTYESCKCGLIAQKISENLNKTLLEIEKERSIKQEKENNEIKERLQKLHEIQFPVEPNRNYYIINSYFGEYLFVSGDYMTGNRIVEARNQIQDRSIFYILKDSQGYLIRNTAHNEYLFLADSDYIGGDRVVESDPQVFEKSYFEFYKHGNEYSILNKKRGVHLFLSNDRVKGDRVVEAKGYEARSLFRLVLIN